MFHRKKNSSAESQSSDVNLSRNTPIQIESSVSLYGDYPKYQIKSDKGHYYDDLVPLSRPPRVLTNISEHPVEYSLERILILYENQRG